MDSAERVAIGLPLHCDDPGCTVTTLVVQAHPLDDSYNAALLQAAVKGMDQPRVVRLGEGDKLTLDSFADIDALVAIYPTWWGSLPAIMLGALNDTIGPWIDDGAPLATNPLAQVRTVTAVTSHGSSKFVNLLQGEPGRHLWLRTVLPLCAPGATFRWQALYKLDRATSADRARFLTQVSANAGVAV